MVDSSRPGFKSMDMFSVSVANSYKKKTQKTTVAGLLNTTDHLTSRSQHYLAKGHLAPDADFVLEAEQDATYLYGNAVPQWQAINNGNWKVSRFRGSVFGCCCCCGRVSGTDDSSLSRCHACCVPRVNVVTS